MMQGWQEFNDSLLPPEPHSNIIPTIIHVPQDFWDEVNAEIDREIIEDLKRLQELKRQD